MSSKITGPNTEANILAWSRLSILIFTPDRLFPSQAAAAL